MQEKLENMCCSNRHNGGNTFRKSHFDSSDLKHFANSQPSALNSKSFSQSLEQSFLTEGKNNFAKGQLIISALPLENRSNQKENTNHYITMIR